jgi:transposase
MSDTSDSKRIIELLEELTKWKRFEGAQLAKTILRDLLSKDAEKLVYQFSDGRGSRDIAALAGVSDFSVRNYWKKWNAEGMVVPSQKFKGRYERVFSLEDFGIEIPPLKNPSETQGQESTQQTTNEVESSA